MYIFTYIVAFLLADSPSKRQRGATLVEYALIVGLIAIVSIAILTALGGHITDLFTEANTAIGGAL